ncbi:MAG: phosphatase PAP2 family protein [Prevotella sp.]
MDLQSFIEFDRNLLLEMNGSESLFWDNFMVILTTGYTWIPLYVSLFYLVVKNNESMQHILLVIGSVLLCVLLAGGITDYIVKPYFSRLRPSNDSIIKYLVQVVHGERGNSYGFFSAHAANTFSIALFFSLLVKNRLLSIALIFWSVLNCYTRVYLGLHYPLDIICGICWGLIVGVVSYWIYKRLRRLVSPQLNYVSSHYTFSGYSVSDIDFVILVLVLTLLYAVIRSVLMYICI